MKLYRKITTFLLVLGALSSCDEDLVIDPLSTISFNSFYQSEDDAQLAVNGMYVKFRDVANDFYLYGDERADNTVQTDLGTGSDPNRNTLQPTTGGADWAEFYRLINDANLIIRFIPDIEFVDNNDKDDILAQAYFVRAWAYFNIARIWGDAPLLLDGFTSSDQEGILPGSRDDVQAIFTQVKADIDQSISLFSSIGVSSAYKASQPAAQALRADVHLWTAKRSGGGASDLNIALNAINSAINDSGATLINDYASVFRTTEATQEDVFSIYFDVQEQSGAFFAWRYNLSDSFYNQLAPDQQALVPFISGSVRFFTSSQVFRDQITANANGNIDSRESIYFVDYLDPAGTQLSLMNKYQGLETSPGINEFTDDYKIYRLGGMLLTRAEILNALGQTVEAIADLNTVRNRAGIGDYTGPSGQTDVDDAILTEMGIELAFEGKRWFDLIRFDRAFDLVPSLQGQTDEGILLWPLSTTTLALNPGLAQNPFYN